MEWYFVLGLGIGIYVFNLAFKQPPEPEEPDEFIIERARELPPPRIRKAFVPFDVEKLLDDKLGKDDRRKELKAAQIEDNWTSLTNDTLLDKLNSEAYDGDKKRREDE